MSEVSHKAAVRIMNWLHVAEDDLMGSPVVTFNGETGTCRGVRLDDVHGLCFTFDDPVHWFDQVEGGKSQRWYPVSTIRHKGI